MSAPLVLTIGTEFNDGIRWINAWLSLIAVMLLFMVAVYRWDTFTGPMKRIVPWVIFTYMITGYGSIEVARLDLQVPLGIRTGLLTINLVGLIIAVLTGLNETMVDDGERVWWAPWKKVKRDGLVEGERSTKRV